MLGPKVRFWLVLYITASSTLLGNTARADSAFGYEVVLDVVYGQGTVIVNGEHSQRELMLDVYTPSDDTGDTRRPAVVLSHGGAHLRGGRRLPPFREAGAVHSRMEDYARLLAPLGYVCFVIEYRLSPESPIPANGLDTPKLVPLDEAITDVGLSRLNFARASEGLPPVDPDDKEIVWNSVMAGAEDMAKAIAFVRENAGRWNVNPDRIAAGGHSAGGGNTLNAAYGLKAPVSAIFPMSPPTMLFDPGEVISGPDIPPVLWIVSQNDVGVSLEAAQVTIPQLRKAGVNHQLVWVPGFPHFYPSGAVSLGDDGTRMSVGERITQFLEVHLKN